MSSLSPKLLHEVVSQWARRKPRALAIINADRRQEIDWATFDSATTALAVGLLRRGLRKGDFLAASLGFLTEHVFLEYACFKIGVIHAPLDLRLPPPEVVRCLSLIQPKAYAFPGRMGAVDFRALGKAVIEHCPFVRSLLQFSPPEETIDGAEPFSRLAEAGQLTDAVPIDEKDGAQVIFTTGSTGTPKPALLSHRGILCQNRCLGTAFGFAEDSRVLINLPPSHVGGQGELLMTTLFCGGTAVLLEAFDAARSMQAIQDHRVNLLGQIPAMFQFEWRLGNYSSYDLSSLQTVVYGGQQVSREFLERLAAMGARMGTGLGLTEASGFCTYTPLTASVDELAAGIGSGMPAYPMSVRGPMREDGSAGEEVPDGKIGHVCFRGPQTFLGYVNDPEATARTVSADGCLYTGDMGHKDERGLHLAGRAKLVIKPAGNQVFPGDVENHIAALPEKVASCGVVGAEHRTLTEAIVAFVEKKPGVELSVQELRKHSRSLASYMRPLHYVVLEPGQMPLNRVVKIDYLRLQQMARDEVARLRANRRWDA